MNQLNLNKKILDGKLQDKNKENISYFSNKFLNNQCDNKTVVKENIMNKKDNKYLENTPDVANKLGLRQNYQEETEKNLRIFSFSHLKTRDSVKINNQEEEFNNFSEKKINEEFFLNSVNNKSENSSIVTLPSYTPDKPIEELFIVKPKAKNSLINYYKIDEDYLDEEFLHFMIPYSKMNNEKFKTKFIHKNIRKAELPKFKTDSVVIGKRKLTDISYNTKSSKINLTQSNFKMRKVSSCKKLYESDLIFQDKYKREYQFKVYEDQQVGFDFRYNQILKLMDFDNDVETDEEQLIMARRHNLESLKSAMENFSTKDLVNKIRFRKSRSQPPKKEKKKKLF